MALRSFTYLPHHGFRCGFSGYVPFCQLFAEGIHDRSFLLAASGGGNSKNGSQGEYDARKLHFSFEKIFGDWDDKKALKRLRVSFENRGLLLPEGEKFFFTLSVIVAQALKIKRM